MTTAYPLAGPAGWPPTGPQTSLAARALQHDLHGGDNPGAGHLRRRAVPALGRTDRVAVGIGAIAVDRAVLDHDGLAIEQHVLALPGDYARGDDHIRRARRYSWTPHRHP